MKAIQLHTSHNIPGGINCPSMIEIIHQKLDVVERLNRLIDGRARGSEGVEQIREMIKIEMDAVYLIISLDKAEPKKPEFEF